MPRSRHMALLLAGAAVFPRASLAAAWAALPTMATGRLEHTATLLPSGKILVVGGGTGSAVLSSAEIYDPATNSWSNAAPMANARAEHTATLLPNGKVLVVGG